MTLEVAHPAMHAVSIMNPDACRHAGDPSMASNGSETWTFLTNHARILILIAENPGTRLRDVADRVRITERAAQRIVAELEAAGYLTHEKIGRRNHYHLRPDAYLRHPLEDDVEIGKLLELFVDRRAGDAVRGD